MIHIALLSLYHAIKLGFYTPVTTGNMLLSMCFFLTSMVFITLSIVLKSSDEKSNGEV